MADEAGALANLALNAADTDPAPCELVLVVRGEGRVRFGVAPGVTTTQVPILLRNNSGDQVAAFRWKTSDNQRFDFRPPMGTVQPGAHVEVVATFSHRGLSLPSDIGAGR